MLIGTINWGVETCRNKLEKHKENEEKMCSTYVVTIVRRICRTFYVVIFARVNESLMNEKKIVVIPVAVQYFKHLVTQAICLGANFL